MTIHIIHIHIQHSVNCIPQIALTIRIQQQASSALSLPVNMQQYTLHSLHCLHNGKIKITNFTMKNTNVNATDTKYSHVVELNEVSNFLLTQNQFNI